MGNSEWVRLTPDDDPTGFILYAQQQEHGFGLQSIAEPGGTVCIWMTNTEALAFSRQLPEVKALLTVAKEAVEHINMCNDELIVPYVLMADTLAAAIADVEGER